MMLVSPLVSTLLSTLVIFFLTGLGTADYLVDDNHIIVFLYAHPAFWAQVAIVAPKDACVDLDNNMLVSLWALWLYSFSHDIGSMVVYNPRLLGVLMCLR